MCLAIPKATLRNGFAVGSIGEGFTAPPKPRFSAPQMASDVQQFHHPERESSVPNRIYTALVDIHHPWYRNLQFSSLHSVVSLVKVLTDSPLSVAGRFRDAEIASESIHSGVQLLSLYHDTLLLRASSLSKVSLPPISYPSSPHGRYTRFWTQKSPLYRRVAYILRIAQYVELLCEMAAKRRGERARWRAVILLEALKAVCRLLLLRITRSRPLVSPVLPEREPVPEPPHHEDEDNLPEWLGGDEEDEDGPPGGSTGQNGTAAHTNGKVAAPGAQSNGYANGSTKSAPHQTSASATPLSPAQKASEWDMPRTGMSLPSLPAAGDISSYLSSRVLTADDIKPATRLLNQLRGPSAVAAEVLHILTPLLYALALARATAASRDARRTGKTPGSAWYPWLLGVGLELAARQLREQQGLRTTALEREEWERRGRAMVWWVMRGPAYDGLVKGFVNGVKRRIPGLVGGILEDYQYLWENYYFSTGP